MSAYIVEEETINKVVSFLHAKANGPDSSIKGEATKLFKMGYDLRLPTSCAELAHKMFDMNVAAVHPRDGEAEGEGFPLSSFKYRFTPASQIEVIKALETWNYQCTEGNVLELDLYKAMAEVHCLLCIDFVEQTEEYEVTSWE